MRTFHFMDIYRFAESRGIRAEDYPEIVPVNTPTKVDWDAWEFVVHELAHFVTLKEEGDIADVENCVAALLRDMTELDQDENEVLTCLVELEVMSRFKSPEYMENLVTITAKGLKGHPGDRWWLINRLEELKTTPTITTHADRVLELLGGLTPWVSGVQERP